MSTLDNVKKSIADAINTALKQKAVKASDLVYPPKPEFGDLSLPCYTVAKLFNKSAVELAEFLVGKVALNDVVVATKAIGPFINFTFNKAKLAQGTIEEILKIKTRYGLNSGGKKKKVMVEFSNGNTHKEYHVGHLRNACYGDAIARILAANGYKSIPVSYVNDFGIHVAKTIWALDKFYKDEVPPEDKGYFLGKVYVRACQEMEKDNFANSAVSFIMKKIESRTGQEYKLWQKTRKWSIDGFSKIHKELGIKFEHIFYENEFINKGLDMVADLYEKGFLIKSQGAVIADLSKYNLGVLVILRSDGTALYPVADLPLAEEKFKKYKIDKSIYVVDVRQSLYFKQLFKVLESLGFKQEMKHLVYEFVKLPEGMMASRTGKVITYEDLRAEALEKAAIETRKRHKNWPKEKLNQVVEKIVVGALKFEMVKVSADKIITFDIEQALRFDGYTAAYLQYTCARINSIMKKSQISSASRKTKSKIQKINFTMLSEAKESILVNKLAKYPEIVAMAGKNYDPSELAKYLFELAQEFNDYYHSAPVLKAKPPVRQARLALIVAVKQVIANGLNLLGIETVEEM